MAGPPDIDLASFVQKYRLWIAAGVAAAALLTVVTWFGGEEDSAVREVAQSQPAGPDLASQDESATAVDSETKIEDNVDDAPDTGAMAPEADLGESDVDSQSSAEEPSETDVLRDLGKLATLPRRPNLPVDDERTHAVTVMRGLDKITAEITELELPAGEPVQFGSLSITARACWSRPPEEPPETYAFLEIDDTAKAGDDKRIFTGWMMASSPALNSLEHPIYDVWVINCKTAEPDASSGSE